jgi:hypothetical protein
VRERITTDSIPGHSHEHSPNSVHLTALLIDHPAI